MAITINTEPSSGGLTLAYRPYVYTFSYSGVPTLISAIVEVVVNSVRVSAKSVQLDLGSSTDFTVDIQNEVQKYVSFQLKTLGASTVITNDDGINSVELKIYEVTENATTLLPDTTYDPADASNTGYDAISSVSQFMNWTETHLDYNTFDLEDYRLNGTTKKFITTSPTVKSIELAQDEFIGILWHQGTAGKNFKLEILTYDASNALLNTDTINITEWSSAYVGVVVAPYLSLPVGTANLIAAGVSLTNVAYYTIRIINDDGDVSELRRFNIVDSCDTDTRLHWVNKFGKQESLTFKGNKVESTSTSTSSFEKALPNTYSSENRGTTTIQTVRDNSFTIYTKSIGREAYEHASSIRYNNDAYVEIGDAYFPITIDDVSVVEVDERDMPIQLSIRYRFANRDKGLRG
jgi:hypothetical protein